MAKYLSREERVYWLDRCRECDNRKMELKTRRCDLWNGVNKQWPMAMSMAKNMKDAKGECSYFVPKEVH